MQRSGAGIQMLVGLLSMGQRLNAKTQSATTFTRGITKSTDHSGAWPVRLRILMIGNRMMTIQKRKAIQKAALKKERMSIDSMRASMTKVQRTGRAYHGASISAEREVGPGHGKRFTEMTVSTPQGQGALSLRGSRTNRAKR